MSESSKNSDKESSSSGEEVVESPVMNPKIKSLLTTPNKKDCDSGKKSAAGSSSLLKPILMDRIRPAITPDPSTHKRQKIDEVKEATHERKEPKAFRTIKVDNFAHTLRSDEEEKKPKEEVKSSPVVLHYRKRPFDEYAKTSKFEVMIQMHSAFYESQREQFHAQRQTSNVIFLRKFNNWVKSILINQTCSMKGNYLSVLDICCGKGGDLQKWQMNRISHYVAVDLSENSVRSASERFKKMKYNGKLPFHSIFIVNNVGDEKNSFLKYIDKRILFDVASCQMSMHYLCESESTARSFLKNVSDKLVPGGYFIGTTLDSNVLVRKLRTIGLNKDKVEKYEFGNQYNKINCEYKLKKTEKGASLDVYNSLKSHFIDHIILFSCVCIYFFKNNYSYKVNFLYFFVFFSNI